MATRRSSRTAAPQSAAPQAAGTKRKSGQPTATKASSGQKNPSTAGTSNLFTPEQLALFNSMHAQMDAQKKATAAAQDEGTLV
jgi:hypothetical protein